MIEGVNKNNGRTGTLPNATVDQLVFYIPDWDGVRADSTDSEVAVSLGLLCRGFSMGSSLSLLATRLVESPEQNLVNHVETHMDDSLVPRLSFHAMYT